MRNRFESIASGTLTLAAVLIAVILAHREFGPKPVPQQAKPPEQIKEWKELVSAGTTIGDPAARVKIVEVGDFVCPFCAQFERDLKTTLPKFAGQVALVYVHMPINTHKFAMPAAHATECAGRQGQFAAYHDALFAKQDSLGLKPWSSYAKDVGVTDLASFETCTSRNDTDGKIAAGQAISHTMGINATPTIVVNGWRFYAPPRGEHLTEIIRAALKSDEELAASIAKSERRKS